MARSPGSSSAGRRGLVRRARLAGADAATSGRSGAVDSGPAPYNQSAAPTPPTRPLPGRIERLRHRILPRSVLGLASLILAFAIGAGFSGVVLYSYYQYKQGLADTKVNNLISDYKTQFAKAEANLAAAAAVAKANIAEQIQAAQQAEGTPAEVATLVKQMAPSVFFVHTLTASGAPSVGTAFVVASNQTESLLLTSYTTVQAATSSPAPAVYVRQGTTNTQVTLRTWDPSYDLALLIYPQGNLPAIAAAPTSPAPKPGDHLFAVSGLASAGAAVDPGTVVDVLSSGLAVDAGLGNAFDGGPIVNQAGQVIAVSSRNYQPLGFASTGVWYTPYVEAACQKVLSCPGGTLVGAH